MADWRQLYSMSTGLEPGVEFVEPYVASITFFGINMMAGIVLRALTAAIVPEPLKGLTLSFLATMEACAYFFENNFVFKYYGSTWLAVAIIAQCFVLSRTLHGASENPVQMLAAYMDGSKSLLGALVQVVVQSLAGLASYRFAQMVWSLDLIADHHERFYETTCSSDLEVTLLVGFLIEMGACMSDTWLQMQTVVPISVIDELIKYGNGAAMIVVGVSTTGMYFNPAMATGHTLGCQGTAMWEHFAVYWAGPFLGCFVALQLNKVMHIDFSSKPVEADKKNN